MKFFPAEPSGGLGMVDALAAAFPQVRFVPTGGIGPENAADYLAHPAVAAIGGSWMVAPSLISAARWVEVAARSAAAVRLFTPEPQAAVP